MVGEAVEAEVREGDVREGAGFLGGEVEKP